MGAEQPLRLKRLGQEVGPLGPEQGSFSALDPRIGLQIANSAYWPAAVLLRSVTLSFGAQAGDDIPRGCLQVTRLQYAVPEEVCDIDLAQLRLDAPGQPPGNLVGRFGIH